jgi:hypothetical protein
MGSVGRALSGGRTAARVGTRVLAYYAKRPFLSQDGRHQAREAAARQGAQALFQGFSLLRIFEMLGARVRFRNPYEW